MDTSSWFSGHQSASSEEERDVAAPDGRRTTSSLSGSDKDLQAAVGYGTSIWRCADLFSVTPSEHSRSASIVEGQEAELQLVAADIEGGCSIGASFGDHPRQDCTRVEPTSSLSQECHPSSTPRSMDARVDHLIRSSPCPSEQSRMSSEHDSSGGASIFAYRQRQPPPSHSHETRRQGTGGTTTSSSGGGTAERKVVSSGIFIVSKSGPSWVSDRPSPCFSTMSLAGQAMGQETQKHPQKQAEKFELLSPECASIPLYAMRDQPLRPQDDALNDQSLQTDDYHSSLPSDVADWLDSQNAEVVVPRFSPGGQTQIITKHSALLTAQPTSEASGKADTRRLSLLSSQRQPRRVSGPRPPRAGSALDVVSYRSASKDQESQPDESDPRARIKSTSLIASELDLALVARLAASASGHHDDQRGPIDDGEEGDQGSERESECSDDDDDNDEEDDDDNDDDDDDDDNDNNDDCSRIAQMGSISSAGLTQHSSASEVGRGAVVEDEGSQHNNTSRYGSQEVPGATDVNSDDEERFWVSSVRGSVTSTPLPNVLCDSNTQSVGMCEMISNHSDGQSRLWDFHSGHHIGPSKDVVIQQINKSAQGTHQQSHNSWRRSHPTLNLPVPIKAGLRKDVRCSSSITAAPGGPFKVMPREAHCPNNGFDQVNQVRCGRESVQSSLSDEDDEESEGDTGDADSRRYSFLAAPVQVHTAKKKAISRGDAVLLLSATPSPYQSAFRASPQPNKRYADACVQTYPSTDGVRHQRWASTSSETETNLLHPNDSRKGRRPDLRIETGVARDDAPAIRPSSSVIQKPLSTSRSMICICCPKCGHDFIPPPRTIDSAAAIDGAKKLAQARVQARAAALAASSSLSLRSAPAHQSAFINTRSSEDDRGIACVTSSPAARCTSEVQRHERAESDEAQVSGSVFSRLTTISFSSDNGPSSRGAKQTDRKERKSVMESSSDSVTAPSQKPASSSQAGGGDVMGISILPTDGNKEELKQPRGNTHARRTSLHDVLNNFRESATSIEKKRSVGQQVAPNKPISPPSRPLLLGRKGSISILFPPNGRPKSKHVESFPSVGGTQVSPSVKQDSSQPQSRTHGEVRSAPVSGIRAGQGLVSWAAPDLVVKPQVAKVEFTKATEAGRETKEEGHRRDRSKIQSSALDLADSLSSDEDDEDSSGIVAPFAKQSVKALKLLGLDDGTNPSMIKGGGQVGNNSSRGGTEGRKPQSSNESKPVARVGHTLSPSAVPGLNRRSDHPTLRQRKSTVRPRTTSSSSSSVLRTSKSYMDFASHNHHSNPPSAALRRETQPMSTAAVFSAGPVEVGAQGNPLKKMRNAWRKGKGKDSTDYRESLEPLPISISAPLGIPSVAISNRSNGGGAVENRGPPVATSSAAPDSLGNNETARTRGRQVDEKIFTVLTTSRSSSISSSSNAIGRPQSTTAAAVLTSTNTTRWALPSLDLQNPPLFNEFGREVPAVERTSVEDDSESISWFTAAYT